MKSYLITNRINFLKINRDENFVKVGESASYENENCDIVLDSGLCLYNGMDKK